MSGAWTPGPWMVNPKASTNVEAGRRGVAACGGYYDNTSDGAYAVENDANAHLISAAPDLYAAGQAIIDQLDAILLPDDAQTAALRAALAKARGEAK